MSESIKQRINAMDGGQAKINMHKLLEAQLTDSTALRTTIAALVVDVAALAAALDTVGTKLNAEAQLSATDYGTGNGAAVTSSAPSALTVTD